MFYLLIDTETTGLPAKPKTMKFNAFPDPANLQAYNGSRIVQIAILIYDSDTKTMEQHIKYVKCDFKIPNSEFHGVTDEICAAQGVRFSEIADWMAELLKRIDCIVAYNIGFDMCVMLSEFYRIERLDVVKLIDSKNKKCAMEYAKLIMNLDRSPKLAVFYKTITGKEIQNAHDALHDILNTHEALDLSGFYN